MTSTTSTVDVGSPSLHPTTTTSSSLPQLVANHGHQAHQVPLPSPEGCGPTSFSLNGRIWEGETRGGTQESGGPRGESRERDTTKVVSRSRCFYLSKAMFD